MNTENLTTEKLFSDISSRFEIPLYQRAYSWDQKQWAQFFDDLIDADSGYYLGHYLFERNGKSQLIIDGQQRLTTCVIFARAVIDVLAGDEKYAKDVCIWRKFYLEDPDLGPRFRTVAYDDPVFQDCIIGGKESPMEFATLSARNIVNAYEYFIRRLRKLASHKIVHDLMDRMSSAVVTKYQVSDRTMAAQIFAFQNDRGKSLTKLETIKSYLMLTIYMKGSSEERKRIAVDTVDHRFAEIYQTITRADLEEDRVLTDYWKSRNDYSAEDVITGIKKQLVESEDPIDWIRTFVAQLSMAFRFVEKFRLDNREFAVRLRLLNNLSLAYPFLIKAFICGIRLDSSAFERLMKLMENLTFRSLIRGGRADIQTRLNGHLRKVSDEASLNVEIENIVNAVASDWWSYWSDKEMLRCLDGWFYGNRVDNYLLWQYELSLYNHGYRAPGKVTASEMMQNESIEHIAPQTCPGEALAAGYGNYDDKEYEENGIVSGGWMNRLGNLMLASQSQNSYLGNHPFSFKLSDYKKNVLQQQNEIERYAKKDENNAPIWTVQSIQDRHKHIVEWAVGNWAIKSV